MRNYAPDPRAYELMTILSPDVPEDQIPVVLDSISGYVTAVGGAVEEVLRDSPWGRRRLAYPIRHDGRDVRDGYYTVYHLWLEPNRVIEVERDLKLNTEVIRYLLTHYSPKPVDPQAAVDAEIDAEEAAAAAYAASRAVPAPAAAPSAPPVPEAAPAAAPTPIATDAEPAPASTAVAAEEPAPTAPEAPSSAIAEPEVVEDSAPPTETAGAGTLFVIEPAIEAADAEAPASAETPGQREPGSEET